jgi:hypothetical protein
MRWVQKSCLCTSGLCALGLQRSNFGTFSGDTSDNGNLVVNGLDESLDDIDLLLLGKESTLASMAKNY